MIELTLPAFTVAPAADAARRGPGVIVVHEGNGMSAQLLRFCERLADQGYRVDRARLLRPRPTTSTRPTSAR